ncbi:hypothetical protein LLR08_22645 [Rouxiella badensis]|jgi:hypothetical protein|uniref:Uncharacterized protein n=1 Tax=Rouxiella badensis TaxID=1646377 RepID=A0A1X0WA12_9GAMM|nr:hypothetical protein [Rouxiella badensis]MCC3705341.1 hypothetical protein [Rouxiella badensis]ORJ23604.1 hypothetical protein BS640_20655 [Rouxiella badensis]
MRTSGHIGHKENSNYWNTLRKSLLNETCQRGGVYTENPVKMQNENKVKAVSNSEYHANPAQYEYGCSKKGLAIT